MPDDASQDSIDVREWLKYEALDGFGFAAEQWTEGSHGRAQVLAALGREIVDSYVDRLYLERRLRTLGYERLADHVREHILPPPGTTRTGDFGEIVSTLVLRRHRGFQVPVLRLRYKDSPGGTQRLIDVVAFKFRKPPAQTVIAVSEVKTRTGSAPGIGKTAVEQLRDSLDDLPLSLTFIERRLTEEGKHFLADLVLELLDADAQYDVEEKVFVVTDKAAIHPDTLTRIEDAALGTPALTAALVLIDDLAGMIGSAYASAGRLDEFAT